MSALVAAVSLTACCAMAPIATADTIEGPYAHATIQRGDYVAAERKLIAEARIFPNKPEILLNLAAIYAKTGRSGEARMLYNRVLELAPIAMDVVDGQIVPSHLVADRGLRLLTTTQVAAR